MRKIVKGVFMEIEDWKNKYEEKLKNFGFVFEKEEKDNSYTSLYYKNVIDSGIFKNSRLEVWKREGKQEKIFADLHIEKSGFYNDQHNFFTEVEYLFDYLEYFETTDKENEEDKFKIRGMWE